MKTILLISVVFYSFMSLASDKSIDINDDCIDQQIRVSSFNYKEVSPMSSEVAGPRIVASTEYAKRNGNDYLNIIETSVSTNSGSIILSKIKICDDVDLGQANCETYFVNSELKTLQEGAKVIYSDVLTIYEEPHCCGPIAITCKKSLF